MKIITYATHEERYLPILKESCPDIIVLGTGNKWNGFKDKVLATVEFCKQHPNEIVCFVDGFDSVVLSSPKEILDKYRSFRSPFVMSQGADSKHIAVKYVQDKLFGKCKHERLNSGMYIGTSEAIVSFWNDFDGGDDQFFATQKCKQFDMKIDVDNILFHNYAEDDDITLKDDRLYVKNVAPCVISCPGNGSINEFLTQLGYQPPVIKYDWKYRFGTYVKTFIPEMILIVAIILVFLKFNYQWAFLISFLMFELFVEYQVHLKHYPISLFSQFVYLFLDFIHILVFVLLIYLIVNLKCNLKRLAILNAIYLITILCFFYFKRCIISIVQNKIIDNEVSWVGPIDRIKYFLVPEKQYLNSKPTTVSWIDSNKMNCTIIVLLNIYCVLNQKK